MQSGIYREHPEHLVPGPKGSLLKTLAIYGPNSSGKSQLINALAFYAAFVRRQLPFSPDSLWNLPGSGSLSGLSYSCCQNRNAAGSSPLSMSMCFFFHGHTFEYGFTLEEDVLTEEYLIVNQTLLFQKDQTLRRSVKGKRGCGERGEFFAGRQKGELSEAPPSRPAGPWLSNGAAENAVLSPH